MFSLVAWPGVPRPGAAPSNLLASSLASVLVAGSAARAGDTAAQTPAPRLLPPRSRLINTARPGTT